MISSSKRWLQRCREWRYAHKRIHRATYFVKHVARRITFIRMTIILYFLLAGIGITLLWPRWEPWVGDRPLGEAIRDIAIIAGALAGLLVAIWRAQVADRQSDIADDDLAYRRYQTATTMLRDQEFAVRFSAIQELEWLAKRYPEKLHIHTMRLLCAFIRTPKEDQAFAEQCASLGKLRDDVQQALIVLGTLHVQQLKIAHKAAFSIDLRGANLVRANMSGLAFSNSRNIYQKWFTLQEIFHKNSGPDFRNANLTDARLIMADLSQADFTHANLSGAYFLNADLSSASFTGADITDAIFHNADLTKARFSTEYGNLLAIGLTQRQLDSAKAQTAPMMIEMIDHKTGEKLIWRSSPEEEVI